MGQAKPALASSTTDYPETSSMPEETHYLIQDALRCFSLVQVLNGAIASAVTFIGYMYKDDTVTGAC